MPRLREMFAQQGIELTDSSVSQHSPGDRREAGETLPGSGTPESAMTGAEDNGMDNGQPMPMHNGLIDTYA